MNELEGGVFPSLEAQLSKLGAIFEKPNSPPREEGWLRHQEIFGAALLSAADGVVAHTEVFGASDHPVRFASTPPHEEGTLLDQNDTSRV